MRARLTLVHNHYASPPFKTELNGHQQPSAFCRAIARDIINVAPVQTVGAMVSNLRTAPLHGLTAMNTDKFFIPVNRIPTDLSRFGARQQCSHQALTIKLCGILYALHSGQLKRCGADVCIPFNSTAQRLHLTA
jgi:hypothetical protein